MAFYFGVNLSGRETVGVCNWLNVQRARERAIHNNPGNPGKELVIFFPLGDLSLYAVRMFRIFHHDIYTGRETHGQINF